jgi:CubicO group peptidase (beta-lactamase class C family)
LIERQLHTGTIPGACIGIGARGRVLLLDAFGSKQVTPVRLPATPDTIFDLASLTKVVATWPSVLALLERGQLALEERAGTYLARRYRVGAVGEATIEQLLTHTAGLPARTHLKDYGSDPYAMIEGICLADLEHPPGSHVTYSNRGFILLGAIVEILTGMDLDRFAAAAVWLPARMTNTCFAPPPSLWQKVAPTEYRGELAACQHGTVHDENAAGLGGIAGHAGVFSTLGDLMRFCALVLAGGRTSIQRVLRADLIDRSFAPHTDGLHGERRGYGWVLAGPFALGDRGGYHLGFTGTSVHLDFGLDAFVVLLTNRVHPKRDDGQRISELRRAVVAEVAQGVSAVQPPRSS